MKDIVFISGKGGTGKSTLVASLCRLTDCKMITDCDVDAPNLHILLKEKVLDKKDFYGAQEARINSDICRRCGACLKTCMFGAISGDFNILPFKCEGCGACKIICPYNAITLEEVKTGNIYISDTHYGDFTHALLDIGAEGSGKLVTAVRKEAAARENGQEYNLIDGSPGIGCVVIASITGADAVVTVTEATLSGLSDMQRVLGVARHFNIPAYVCINKYDLNYDVTAQIEQYCNKNNIKVIGKLPFEPKIVHALREFKTPVEAGLKEITAEIKNIWNNIVQNV